MPGAYRDYQNVPAIVAHGTTFASGTHLLRGVQSLTITRDNTVENDQEMGNAIARGVANTELRGTAELEKIDALDNQVLDLAFSSGGSLGVTFDSDEVLTYLATNTAYVGSCFYNGSSSTSRFLSGSRLIRASWSASVDGPALESYGFTGKDVVKQTDSVNVPTISEYPTWPALTTSSLRRGDITLFMPDGAATRELGVQSYEISWSISEDYIYEIGQFTAFDINANVPAEITARIEAVYERFDDASIDFTVGETLKVVVTDGSIVKTFTLTGSPKWGTVSYGGGVGNKNIVSIDMQCTSLTVTIS